MKKKRCKPKVVEVVEPHNEETNQTDNNCFICGSVPSHSSHPVTRSSPTKRAEGEEEKVSLFQTLLKVHNGTTPTKGKESCPTCLQSVREVWDFHQQVQTIQKKIKIVLDKAHDLIVSRQRHDAAAAVEDNPPSSPPIDTPTSPSPISPSSAPDDLLAQSLIQSEIMEPPTPAPSTTISPPRPKKRRRLLPDVKAKFSYPPPAPPLPSGPPFPCTHCGYTFVSKTGWKLHLTTKHGPSTSSSSNSFPCSKCGRNLSSKAACMTHEVVTCQVPYTDSELAQNGIKLATCSVPNCGVRMRNDTVLIKRHMIRDHGEELPYACSKCGKSFLSKVNWLSHEVTVCQVPYDDEDLIKHGLILHPCPMPGCSKKYQKYAVLERHIRFHTGIKPFKCSFCPREFSCKRGQEEHETRKHTADPERKALIKQRDQRSIAYQLKCKINCPLPGCQRRFETQAKVELHIAKVHGDKSTGDRVLCTICGASPFKANYLDHMRRVHERKYHRHPCKKCGKICGGSYELRIHSEKCTGTPGRSTSSFRKVNLKECPHCGEMFHPLSLRKHLKRHEALANMQTNAEEV